MKTRCFFVEHLGLIWVLLEVLDGSLRVIQQKRAEVAADTVPHQGSLDDEISHVGRQSIRRNPPTARPQPVGEIVEAKSRMSSVPEFPTKSGDASSHLSIVKDLEGPQLFDLAGQVLGRFIAGGGKIAFSGQRRSTSGVMSRRASSMGISRYAMSQ